MTDATLTALEKVLDLRTQAHQIHTSNLANANVNDFKAKKIDFDQRLRAALEPLSDQTGTTKVASEISAQNQLNQVVADVYEDPIAPMNANGNTVNPDKEQAEIAKNMIGFQTAVQLVNKKMALQKYIISEGGR